MGAACGCGSQPVEDNAPLNTKQTAHSSAKLEILVQKPNCEIEQLKTGPQQRSTDQTSKLRKPESVKCSRPHLPPLGSTPTTKQPASQRIQELELLNESLRAQMQTQHDSLKQQSDSLQAENDTLRAEGQTQNLLDQSQSGADTEQSVQTEGGSLKSQLDNVPAVLSSLEMNFNKGTESKQLPPQQWPAGVVQVYVHPSSGQDRVWGPILDVMKRESEAQQANMLAKFQAASNPEELQEISKQVFKDLLTNAKDFSNRHADMMEALWDRYATLVDGHLQLEELITMQQHAMQHDAEKVDENVATAVDAFFESMETTHTARGVSAEDLQELKLQRDAMIASAKDKALQQLEVSMKPLALKKSAKDMWHAMDLDQDGVVTKEEFFKQYVVYPTELVIRNLAALLKLPSNFLDHIEAEERGV